MKNDLEEVIKRLDALTIAVENNTQELRKIRLNLFGKKKDTPKSYEITHPVWCCEFPSMTVTLTSKQWKEIASGKVLIVRGHGNDISQFVRAGEPTIEWDYWTFNEPSPGKVTVYVGEPERDGWRDVSYEGNIDNCEIVERNITSKRKAKAR